MLQRGASCSRRLAGILRSSSAIAQQTLSSHAAFRSTAYNAYDIVQPSWKDLNPGSMFTRYNLSFSTAAGSSAPLTNLREFRLAQTGEGIQECELVRWYVQEGDPIEEFGRVCEVQSDKATIEITSPFSGIVKHLKHGVGDTVPVGEVLAEILVADDGSTAEHTSVESIESAATAGIMESSLGDEKRKDEKKDSREILTSPAVRRMAQELQVDLALVTGTGPNGRISKENVTAYVESQQQSEAAAATPMPSPPERLSEAPPSFASALAQGVSPSSPASAPPVLSSVEQPEDMVVPLRGYRKAMFKAMTAAASIPHFHYCDEVSTDTLVELRSRLQGSPSLKGSKLTFMPFFIKAAAMALMENPMINCSLAPSGDSLLQHSYVNIGVAVATPLGLVVPNIKNVESRSIAEIATELARLQSAAMANQLRPEDITGGTFTISNIGVVGGTYATPLINPPEVAIMALGRIQKLPRYAADGSGVQPTNILSVSLGADHRVVDGATLAGFGVQWKTLVEDPGRLLLELR